MLGATKLALIGVWSRQSRDFKPIRSSLSLYGVSSNEWGYINNFLQNRWKANLPEQDYNEIRRILYGKPSAELDCQEAKKLAEAGNFEFQEYFSLIIWFFAEAEVR